MKKKKLKARLLDAGYAILARDQRIKELEAEVARLSAPKVWETNVYAVRGEAGIFGPHCQVSDEALIDKPNIIDHINHRVARELHAKFRAEEDKLCQAPQPLPTT